MNYNLKSSTLVGAALLCALTTNAYAYTNGTHYVYTEVIASACDIPYPKLIAWADAWVDLNPSTSPEIPTNVAARAMFHFRTSPTAPMIIDIFGRKIESRIDRVYRGSREAAAIVDQAIERSETDQILLGIGLHAYQDSWAHESYEPGWGHVFAFFRPDDPNLDQPRTLEMAEATWQKIDRWSSTRLSQPCAKNWSEVRPLIEQLLTHSTDELKQMARDYPSGVNQAVARETFNYWIAQINQPNFFSR